jgi:uncharacterized protein
MRILFALLIAVGFALPGLAAHAAEPEVIYWEDLMPPEGLKALEDAYAAAAGAATPLSEVDSGQSDTSDLAVDGNIAPGADPDDPTGTRPAATQFGTFDVVEELDGKTIRIPGFMVPFDINEMSEVSEFLLVPYFGACIHVPPPPPNQIVYVTTEEAVPFGWEPVWLEGVLETKTNVNNLGSAAYTLNLTKLEPYTDG